MGSCVAQFFQPEGDISLKTSQICAHCSEEIVFTEEVFLIQMVQPHFVKGDLLLHPILEEDGDYAFDPHFLQFDCWEGIEEDLQKEIEDVPPVEDSESILHCRYCQSGIREWEFCGALSPGEVHVSPRAPNGGREEQYHLRGQPKLICLYCLLVVNESTLEFWEAISQDGECGDCTQGRCWRLPAPCPCTCHKEEAEENND